MNILLVCNAGMSTSLLVTKMQNESEANGNQDTIFACSVDELELHIDNCEVVLIGPQIRYKLKSISEIATAKGKGYAVIDSVSYGMVDGKKVLAQAYQLKK
ncbi:PTS sugar transporter subunit IIB [Pelosinus sp. UFO1]|jgi:PTS system cellobiose-specific IIB component|uniref:PTS sugar transporter subunit IIB n=1 Tax=Pelosinus sp. UFO1 TaxID=484770 RepID=UPI0004D16CDA|nr:PTS sugar transporter subunit IIB [Pelosinus sp. UFO1]AIF54300.1 phosphotransferase system lactose/cellobiose-specific IIB subunit [Pelosinus sp. UFO1]